MKPTEELATTITAAEEPSPPVVAGDGERSLPAGTMLGARYRIVRFLGAGGMGAVYLAHDLTIGSEVALKLMLARWRSDADALTRVRAEVALAHKVTHRNVCRTYDLETLDGHSVVKMEYVAGATLAERIGRGPVPVPEAVALAAQIAAGLEAAHAQGIVHCDLKPQNVMLSGDRVVLMDFGVSRAAMSSGRARGTPPYMAPEVWRGGAIDGRTDLYALGCVLHQMLSGARPFEASTPSDWQARHCDAPPPELRGVPRRLARLARDLMAKDPADRPRDATAVLERLRPPRPGPRYALAGIAVIAVIAVASPRSHEWRPEIRLRSPAYQETGDSIAVSHDGKWLAYDSDRDGHLRIWIEPVAGGEARPVTPPDWVSQVPRFTADDRALLVKRIDRLRTMTTVQSLSRIERVPLDNGAPALIAARASSADDCAGRIVLGYNSEANRPARITVLDDGTERILAVLGTDVELGRIRCSPAGDAYAFNARGIHIGGHGMQLFVGHVDQLGVRQLTRGASAARPSFTLDGNSLIFATHGNSLAELPLDGGEPRMLTRATDPLSEAVVLPDGALLYLRDSSSMPVSRLDLATGVVTRLARPADWTFQAAPACGGLALLSAPTFALERWSVVLVDPATNRTRELGHGSAIAATADGATIVVAQLDHGVTHLKAFDCDTSSRELAAMTGVIGHIAVARGIVHVTLTGNACVAWRVPLAGGAPECEGPPPLQRVIPAPVGDHVIVVRDSRLRLIAPGHPLDDASAPEFDGETAAWAPEGDAFYYWDGHAVVRHELATGRDRALHSAPLFVGALAPMPDGQTLYFTSIAGEVRREIIANFAARP